MRVQLGDTVARGVLIEERPRPPDVGMHVEALEGEEWRSTPDLHVLIGSDLRFTIHSTKAVVPPRLRLRVTAEGCQPVTPIEFQPGQELRVVLRQGAPLRVRTLLPAFLLRTAELESMYLGIATEDESFDTLLTGRVIDGAWVVESHSLPTGRFTLWVEGAGFVKAARLTDVQIAFDGPPDPRLDPWDLRDRIQMLEIRLHKQDGSPANDEYEVYAKVDQEEWEWCGSNDPGSECVLPRQQVDLLLQFEAGGYVLKRNVVDSVDVTVPTGSPVQIVLTGMPQLVPSAPLRFSVKPAPAWSAAKGLPPSASPIYDPEWEREPGRITMKVFEAAEVEVILQQSNEKETTVATWTCQVSPSSGTVKLTFTDEQRRALAPWMAGGK